MEFVTRTLRNNADMVEVRYDCACGCKPSARYQKGTEEAGHEHCCCGRVHFVGYQASAKMVAYMQQRRQSGEDTRTYTVTAYKVKAPWGEVPVAYGEPDTLTPH